MKQTFHFLDNTTTRNITDKYLVLDIETNGLRATPDNFLFCCLYGKNFKKEFYTVEEIKKELLQRKYRGKYIFAHNAEYDLSGIYGNILKNLDDKAIFNGKFICATNGVVTFADSHNIIQGSVESIGESIGLKKTMVYSKLDGKSKKIKITQKEIDGCYRDCEIIYKALEKIFLFCGELKITIGSLSMNYFRRNFLEESISHDDTYDIYFYASYFGGRVEALQLGRVNAYKYDVNSMYPFVMRNIILPHPNFFKKTLKPSVNSFVKKYMNKEGLVSASVTHKKNNYGFLPVRMNEEVVFPVGKLKGLWNLNEFRYAFNSGMIKIDKINFVIHSERNIKNLFTKFVDTLYKKRLEAKNKIDAIVPKNLLNNLYGKFGTKVKPKTYFINSIEESEGFFEKLENNNAHYKLIKTGGHYLCEVYYNQKQQFSIPSFASYITSAARVHLLKLFVEHEKSNIVYCDTDSIAVKKKLKIENTLQLGGLKLEKEKIIEIKGNKHYIELKESKQTLKLKGVPKNHTKEGNVFIYKKMIKTKESLRLRKEAGTFEEVRKELKKQYTKRINNLPLKLK